MQKYRFYNYFTQKALELFRSMVYNRIDRKLKGHEKQ